MAIDIKQAGKIRKLLRLLKRNNLGMQEHARAMLHAVGANPFELLLYHVEAFIIERLVRFEFFKTEHVVAMLRRRAFQELESVRVGMQFLHNVAVQIEKFIRIVIENHAFDIKNNFRIEPVPSFPESFEPLQQSIPFIFAETAHAVPDIVD